MTDCTQCGEPISTPPCVHCSLVRLSGGDPRSRSRGGPGRGREQRPRRNRKGGSSNPIGTFLPLEPDDGVTLSEVLVGVIYDADAETQTIYVALSDGTLLGGDAFKVLNTLRSDGTFVYTTVRTHQLIGSAGRAGWEVRRYNKRISSIRAPNGLQIVTLHRAVGATTQTEALEMLDFFEVARIAPSGMVSMARNFWRTTLGEPVTFAGLPWGQEGTLSQMAYPARLGGWTGTYGAMAYDDIAAAYPTALAAGPFPSAISLSPATGEHPLAAEATVEIPSLRWGPLPVRVGPESICYGWGDKVRGWWSWRELQTAANAGTKIEFHNFLRRTGPNVSAFGAWYDWAMELRSSPRLGPVARKLAKAVTTITWAMFAMSSARKQIFVYGDHGKEPLLTSDTTISPPTRVLLYVANEVQARIRDQVWRDGLTQGDAVYCNTDGVIRSRSLRTPQGWSRRYDMRSVTIAGIDLYRWTEPGANISAHPPWRYCIGGVDTTIDEELAGRAWRAIGEPSASPGQELGGEGPFSGTLLIPQELTRRRGDNVTANTMIPTVLCSGCGVGIRETASLPHAGFSFCSSSCMSTHDETRKDKT